MNIQMNQSTVLPKDIIFMSLYITKFIAIAIQREKTIKKWKREWKWNLINKVNPLHQNLYCGNNILPIEIAQ